MCIRDRLYAAGFKTLEDLRRARIEELIKVPRIGPGLALSIKEQLGAKVSEEELKAIRKGELIQKSLLEYSG